MNGEATQQKKPEEPVLNLDQGFQLQINKLLALSAEASLSGFVEERYLTLKNIAVRLDCSMTATEKKQSDNFKAKIKIGIHNLEVKKLSDNIIFDEKLQQYVKLEGHPIFKETRLMTPVEFLKMRDALLEELDLWEATLCGVLMRLNLILIQKPREQIK